MGLLRKAAGAVPAGETKAVTSATLPPLPSATVGLLRKSIRVLAACGEPNPTGNTAHHDSQEGDIAREVVESSKALSGGVELPSLLFTNLRKRLSITKGAFLLYDSVRLEYAPWASHGFDQTTLHRMRIPLGANDTFDSLANGEPVDVTSPEGRADFQRFFSSREFSTLEHLTLCPCVFQDTLVAVLVIVEMHHPFKDTAQLLTCLKDVAVSLSAQLRKARGFLATETNPKRGRLPATPEEQFAQLLGSKAAQGRRMLFLSLALGPYVRELSAAYEDLDLFRLREDVRSLLNTFLADVGVAVMFPTGAYLVSLQGLQRDDIPLFLHQLQFFLASSFATAPSQDKAPLIEVLRSRVWPDEGLDVKELVSFLSS